MLYLEWHRPLLLDSGKTELHREKYKGNYSRFTRRYISVEWQLASHTRFIIKGLEDVAEGWEGWCGVPVKQRVGSRGSRSSKFKHAQGEEVPYTVRSMLKMFKHAWGPSMVRSNAS